MSKFWSAWEIRLRLRRGEPLWVERAVLAIFRCHVQGGVEGFEGDDAATGLRLGRLLQRGFRLADLPALNRWALRQMPKYARQLARIANASE